MKSSRIFLCALTLVISVVAMPVQADIPIERPGPILIPEEPENEDAQLKTSALAGIGMVILVSAFAIRWLIQCAKRKKR